MENTQTSSQIQKIDIRQLFLEKNPKLAPLIPGFIYSWLKKILHLDFINYFLEKHGEKMNLEFAKASVTEFNITTTVKGLENLSENGRYIFVANHPLGGFDGMLLISIIGEKFSGIKTLANDILMNIRNMHDVFVPINKHGRQSAETVRNIEKTYEGNDPVLTFPSGLVSRRRKGVIKDLEWKKNFVVKAKQHQRDIVPVWVSGRCTNRFYNIANIRKFLGIKANIEMFFLPDETYRHKNEHIKIVFGKPISWSSLKSDKKPAEWANMVRDLVYQLDSKPEATLP
jgi:putative hemolysin